MEETKDYMQPGVGHLLVESLAKQLLMESFHIYKWDDKYFIR